ncbi:MAG: tetratricopeptide repeat protein [Proteobacteria bacterium]|nr:tetratricopeptide repeat protein [Pseudomonadota bacterium]
MNRRRRMVQAAAVLACVPAALRIRAAELPANDDFSARLDRLWDYGQPAASAERFAALRRDYPARSREALEIETQLARTDSLQRQFAAAHARLDTIEPALARVDARVTVRYRLERGRTYNSAGDREQARRQFTAAYAVATRSGRDGDVFYAIDALHMLAIVASGDEALAWNRKALAAATQARDPRARGWRASLLNNIGWTYFDAGDYAGAVGAWESALALRIEAGDASRVREARWALARGWRAQGKLDDAERAQRAIVAETEALGAPDGYACEELMEIAVARDQTADAARWAALAYALLRDDPDVAGEPARLARIQLIAGATR